MTSNTPPDNKNPLYMRMLELDDLEGLLEELQDLPAGAPVPTGLVQRIAQAGVANQQELRARIAKLHEALDSEEDYGTGY